MSGGIKIGDIVCKKCGEPWETYYVYHEMEDLEKKKFLKGEGCPSCAFGFLAKEDHTEDFIRTALEETDEPDSVLDLWG